MRIKEFICNNMVCKDCCSNNIEQYMKMGLERGNTIYFYSTLPLEQGSLIDKMPWIREIKHEEYDKISIHSPNGRKMYYYSRVLSDKVIKLDLTDITVKKIFDDKFKIGTTWVDVGKNNSLFDKEPGYEIYDFVVTKDDEVIMNVTLHGGFIISISKDIVDEVDKKCKKERWRRIISPFSR